MAMQPPARLNRWVLVAACGILLVLGGWLWKYSVERAAAGEALTVSGNVVDIPLPAGVQHKKVDQSSPGQGSHVWYEVNDTAANITEFYRDMSQRAGWVLDWEAALNSKNDAVDLSWGGPRKTELSLHFKAIQTRDEVPYDLSLFVDLVETREDLPDSALTKVHVGLYRVPILDRVPIPAGSAVTGTKDEIVETYGGQAKINHHVTTYRTKLTPDEVRAFYSGMLVQYGWLQRGPYRDPKTDIPVPGSLQFSWQTGSPHEGMRNAAVAVIIYSDPGSDTKVELRTFGNTGMR